MLQFPRPEVANQLSPDTPNKGLNQSQVCNYAILEYTKNPLA